MDIDLAVIGGGAAGITAAITAARRGKKVTVIEKNDRIGKKLLATGNGKCNLANELLAYDKYNTPLVGEIFFRIGLKEILDFFDGLGLMLRVDEGRVYPYSEQASAVLNALRAELARLGVSVLTGCEVQSISKAKNFVLGTSKGDIGARNVVFATGSEAGFGYNSLGLLSGFGLKYKKPQPSLVPLITDTTYLKGLKGVRTKAKATLIADGRVLKETTDEVLFKDNGLSGTAIFTLSTYLARANAKSATVKLDFVPELTESELIAKLKGGLTLDGLFHKELAANIVRLAGGGKAEAQARVIKNFEVAVKGLSSMSLAQVTSGGLCLEQFDLATMQCKTVKGLYAVGEALDVDGECGGYNLMWAWASGMVAGETI